MTAKPPGSSSTPARGNAPRYVGRFAPSPTGPLHFGSLVAAVGSFLEARSQGGSWLVRIEDVDRPREVPGAADAILRTLEAYGLTWDGPLLVQSGRTDAYRAALSDLERLGAVYGCSCSRKAVAEAIAASGGRPGIYPGTCRGRPCDRARAIRVSVPDRAIAFEDAVQGVIAQNLATETGDFVIRRADRLFAYQLAVVVDDAAQGVTHVVRGSDLLDSTVRQIYLQHLLGYATPQYLHLPVAVNARGEKLSKQTHAPALGQEASVALLVRTLTFLGQLPPSELNEADLPSFWRWAIANWRADRIPGRTSLPAEPAAP